MVVSMTGYGRGKAENASMKIFVEVKTVNHRFCEYFIRMPRQLLILEDKVKKKASEYIRRGRVEIFITIEGEELANKQLCLDWKLAGQYFSLMEEAKRKFDVRSEPSLQDLLQIDNMFTIEESQNVNHDLGSLLLAAVEEAMEDLTRMRALEGKELRLDLELRLSKLDAISESLKEEAPTVAKQYQNRLIQKMSEAANGIIDESRLLTEVAIYADKVDINEEITRLHSHLLQFSETLELAEPIGRKLDFLIQEMNREVNTIGSKANDSQITRKVVDMKSELEKMKEQVQNIE